MSGSSSTCTSKVRSSFGQHEHAGRYLKKNNTHNPAKYEIDSLDPAKYKREI